MNYTAIRNLVLEACPIVREALGKNKGIGIDGRLASAGMEQEVVKILQGRIREEGVEIDFEIPRDRHWFDVRIGSIPINIKITNGGTDNAFNKVAVIYSLTGWEPPTKNMNFNQFCRHLLDNPWIRERNPLREYHYLVFHKNTGEFLFRSLLDIEAFQSNPSNILQICWKNEFQRRNLDQNSSPDAQPTDSLDSGIRILETCQKSLRGALESSQTFIDAKIKAEIHFTNLQRVRREHPRESPIDKDASDQS